MTLMCQISCIFCVKWSVLKKIPGLVTELWLHTTQKVLGIWKYFFPRLLTTRSVAANICFSIDSDLHEKSLHRIESIWCQNHVESNLYVFVSFQLFFSFPFRIIFLSVQKYRCRYYMALLSSNIGSIWCMNNQNYISRSNSINVDSILDGQRIGYRFPTYRSDSTWFVFI